jgi:hypothetical protein
MEWRPICDHLKASLRQALDKGGPSPWGYEAEPRRLRGARSAKLRRHTFEAAHFQMY